MAAAAPTQQDVRGDDIAKERQQQEPQQVDAHGEEQHAEEDIYQPAAEQGTVTEAAAADAAHGSHAERGDEAAAQQQAVVEPQALHPAEPEAAAEAQSDQQQQAEAQQEEVLEEPPQEQQHGVVRQHAPQHKLAAAAAAGSLARAPTGTNKCADADKGLTFSGPPYVPKAKPYKRIDYSHSAVELMKIAHDNELLVKQLTTISKAVPAWSKDVAAPPAPGNTASSAINRRKQATVIAQANHALYQQLVAIKPSKDISRQTLEAEHRQNEIYRYNCAQFKEGTGRASPVQ